jgi:hypothetical protein
MFRAAIVRSLCLGLVCGTGSVAAAQDFSAEVFNVTGKDSSKAGKVYVKGAKMRIDRGEASPEQSTPLVLVDAESHTATIIDAVNHVYMRAEVGPEQGLSFFRLKDANNACADFEKIASMNGCKKAGNEMVGGRPAVKYAGKSDDGKPVTMWVDFGVNFVVKWQTNSGEIGELRNIKVAPQADASFEIPSGFHDAVQGADGEGKPQDTKGDSNKEEPPSTNGAPPSTPQSLKGRDNSVDEGREVTFAW